MNPTIAFDIDGVLADVHTPWLKKYNEDYNDDLDIYDIKQWEISKIVKKECGDKILGYLNASIYEETPPIDGALEAVNIAREFGRVIFATQVNFDNCTGLAGVKYTWLKKHGFDPGYKNYIECNDKGLIRAAMLIDDYEKNLYAFDGIRVIVTQPWNKTVEGFHRIENFENFEIELSMLLTGDK